MRQTTILRVVVASPLDVQRERSALDDVVAEVNRGVAADRGVRLELVRWETDSYPGFDPKGPQGLIDPILRITDCDLLIGIFWKRFGTPTLGAGSGTEHEIQAAYEAWQRSGTPQIMVYFNEQPAAPTSSDETDQWTRVLRFKEAFPKEGLWWAYKGHAQFEKLVRNHLMLYVRDHFTVLKDAPEHGIYTDLAGQPAPAQVPHTPPKGSIHDENPLTSAVQALERQGDAARVPSRPIWSPGKMEPGLKLQYVMAELDKYGMAESDRKRREDQAYDRFLNEVFGKA